jgi:hypothetical protein
MSDLNEKAIRAMNMNGIDNRILDQIPVCEPSVPRINERVLKFHFRWVVKQTDAQTVEVHVPTGGTQPIINPRWIEMMKMTEAQVEKHELAILRDVAILPE